MSTRARLRENRTLDQAFQAPAQGSDLPLAEQLPQLRDLFVGVVVQLLLQPDEIIDQMAGNLLAGKVPDHGTQLIFVVKTDAVVDRPEMTAGRAGYGRPCGRHCSPAGQTGRLA